MPRRHFRHQASEQGPQDLGQPLYDTGLFGDFQEAQPESEGTEQQDHDLHRQLGHGEDALDHRREDAGIAAHQPLGQGADRRHREKPSQRPLSIRVFP